MKILLAEDELSLSKALVTIFKHNNYSIDAVYDGESALDFIKTGIYDLIILDLMMPKKNGLEVLVELRKLNFTTPVLILTAKSDIEDKIVGLDLGADDYLTKPFEVKELLARVRALTRRPNVTFTNNLEFGNITLNPSTYELSNGKTTIHLLNKEYQLMELFFLNPNSIMSIDHIIDKIWGFDCDADYNVVWTYISYLRKKLVSLNADFEIKATRNIGYSLVKTHD